VIAFVIVVGSAVGFVILTSMALVGGSDYTVEDTMAHAADYADVIEEGHGRMTLFLWFTYGLMLAWTVYYLVRHWHEFSVIG
jgi:hypothetical protein